MEWKYPLITKMEIPLSQLGTGKTGIIKYLDGGMGFQRKISSLGLRIGKEVRIISMQPFRGPLVVRVDSIRVALGRGMANKIIVEVK